MANDLTPVSGEVLEPLTKAQTNQIERHARSLYGEAQRSAVQFAAELRRLQDGGAHLIRGYPNFGAYAESLFEGLSSINAQQMSRQGNVLLILEREGRISLAGKGTNLPGTTGVRVLSVVMKKLGQEKMLEIYDRAFASGRKVIDQTVNAAMAELVAPPVHELGEGSVEEPEDDDDDDGYTQLPEEIEALLEQMGDCIHDVRFALLEAQPGTAKKNLKELTDLAKSLLMGIEQTSKDS